MLECALPVEKAWAALDKGCGSYLGVRGGALAGLAGVGLGVCGAEFCGVADLPLAHGQSSHAAATYQSSSVRWPFTATTPTSFHSRSQEQP